jgi:hypothetical protein
LSQRDWALHVAECRERLAFATALLGEWVGRGTAHEAEVEAALGLRLVLDGTAIEARERVGDHEDLCLYRWDADERRYVVHHFMAGAAALHAVELTPRGMVWVTPPFSPAVEWWVDGEDLRCDVVWPQGGEPEVAIRYRRVV